jgi:hypothetical protein
MSTEKIIISSKYNFQHKEEKRQIKRPIPQVVIIVIIIAAAGTHNLLLLLSSFSLGSTGYIKLLNPYHQQLALFESFFGDDFFGVYFLNT